MFPDFPTAARLAQAMWERAFGVKVDGVISLDPVALSYMIGATADVTLANGEVLTEENVVQGAAVRRVRPVRDERRAG